VINRGLTRALYRDTVACNVHGRANRDVRFHSPAVYRSSALTRIILSTINPHPDWPLARCLRASFGNWFVALANFRRLLFPPPPILLTPLLFSLQDPRRPSFATNCVNLPADYLSL